MSFLGVLCLTPILSQAGEPIRIYTPVYTRIEGVGTGIISNEDSSGHTLESALPYPLTLTFKGPLGGIIRKDFRSAAELDQYRLEERVIKDKDSRPQNLAYLPALCPRIILKKNSGIPLYQGQLDRINHIPTAQLMDPDARKGQQYKAYAEMDGKNVLLLRRIRLKYDYEDSNILDYSGPHPLTGKPQEIYEGEGGFYANIHYAVIPYRDGMDQLSRQELLHLAQGKLDEIDRNDLTPALRTHSFLPGPFLSAPGVVYDMCEWGDTAHQAPVQEMDYQNFALWDWDYSVPSAQRVLLVIWEGDEEEWMVQKKLLSPFTLTDDVIAVFEIRRKKTLKPLTLTNASGDFEITVETGDLDVLMK